MRVTTAELRRATNVLLDHLEETGQSELVVEDDYYWVVAKEQLYDPSTQPTELTLGQLSDDLAEIRRIGDGSAPIVGFALVWVAALLRKVGEAAHP